MIKRYSPPDITQDREGHLRLMKEDEKGAYIKYLDHKKLIQNLVKEIKQLQRNINNVRKDNQIMGRTFKDNRFCNDYQVIKQMKKGEIQKKLQKAIRQQEKLKSFERANKEEDNGY